VALIIEEIGVGDAIPLHRHQIDEVLLGAGRRRK
jgi:hypothetical protein